MALYTIWNIYLVVDLNSPNNLIIQSANVALPQKVSQNTDWTQALLAIGTLGNKELHEELERDNNHSENVGTSDDLSDFTVEELDKLQRQLKWMLAHKPKPSSNGSEPSEEDRANLPLSRFLNCASNLEVDRKVLGNENNGDLSPNTQIVLNKVKDMLLGNPNALKKRSISFLLKKMFVCSHGFAPTPSLRDPIHDSRMEKVKKIHAQSFSLFNGMNNYSSTPCCMVQILKAILNKKINQQNSGPASSKNYLDNKTTEITGAREEGDKSKDHCKWIKTDSDCKSIIPGCLKN